MLKKSALIALCWSFASGSYANEDLRPQLNIPAGTLVTALEALSRQAAVDLVYQPDQLQGMHTDGVIGMYSPEEAIRILLSGKALQLRTDESSGAMVIAPQTATKTSSVNTESVHSDRTKLPPRSFWSRFRLAQAESLPITESVHNAQASGDTAKLDSSRLALEEIVVTGTNIRNIKQNFSPVTSISREELELAGYASPADYLQQLPQNFGGGDFNTPDRAFQSGAGAGFASVNLRGLGGEASLVLLNGRRVAPSGQSGASVDVSLIPSAALERVDVLTDGASAVYGSDSVAGVVNFVLRRDYVGNESRIRIGSKSGDATDYSLSHTWGIAGQRGRFLASYEYSSEDALGSEHRSYTSNLEYGNEILPTNNKHGLLLSSGLALPSGGELFSDLYYSKRDSAQEVLIYGHQAHRVRTESANATAGVKWPFKTDWMGELSASYSSTDFENNQYEIPSQPGFSHTSIWNEEYVWSLDAKADGSILDLPAGAVRGVIGMQFRSESHDGASDSFDENGRPFNLRAQVADNKRTVKSVFTEIYAPLASTLEVTAAARYDHYSDFGSTFNPKFGLAWSPFKAITLRGTYGTSFKAPRLQRLVDSISYVALYDYIDPTQQGGMSVAAYLYGNRSDLGAEESESTTLGIELNPDWAPNLNARLNFYEVDYTSRIASATAQRDSAGRVYFWPLPVDRSVTKAQLDSWLANSVYGVFNFTAAPGGSNSSLDDVSVLFDGRPMNTSGSRQRGIDFDLGYRWVLPESLLSFKFGGNYLIDAEDQFSKLVSPVRKYGYIFLPAQFRARAGMNWGNDVLSVNIAANYVDSNQDNRYVDQRKNVGSWLTFDASVQYRLDSGTSNWLNNTRITASAQNIFDKDPPRIAPSMEIGGGAEYSYVAYDSANADPYGRWISVSFTKQW